jgi:hypothetical protein
MDRVSIRGGRLGYLINHQSFDANLTPFQLQPELLDRVENAFLGAELKPGFSALISAAEAAGRFRPHSRQRTPGPIHKHPIQ